MKTNRIFLLAALLLSTSLGLSSCGSNNSVEGTSQGQVGGTAPTSTDMTDSSGMANDAPLDAEANAKGSTSGGAGTGMGVTPGATTVGSTGGTMTNGSTTGN